MTEQSPPYIKIFDDWMAQARVSEIEDPDAACVATVDENGMPNARMVLMRIADERGFTFFTNYNSQKGREILNHPKAAICFHWKSLQRQVRIQGLVEKTSDAEADAYFNSRARGSRIAAWASLQSAPLESREVFEERLKKYEAEFDGLENPPRPPHWSGFRIVPQRVEFWQQVEFRRHERTVFIKRDQEWHSELLYP
ncbi:MAG: pyridoxamine 5'-phosphate oxidase [Micavibrio aeruginosavorus]|uniref:Pyridoxamine 5'-phosphate oxidase n=1 Tax=Micavibrio aeruginosavorus TaxID=349221 RepID=A0A2W5FMZ1_9BACT|nr:MAG: pyridoxamine 5'-phosphate oxidase [Micavibrio aeruginosavorus]